jgi:hypothetical protein
MEDLDPTWTSPTSDAQGATNESSATLGFLSKRFINGRCLDTAYREQTAQEYELAESPAKQICSYIHKPTRELTYRISERHV